MKVFSKATTLKVEKEQKIRRQHQRDTVIRLNVNRRERKEKSQLMTRFLAWAHG